MEDANSLEEPSKFTFKLDKYIFDEMQIYMHEISGQYIVQPQRVAFNELITKQADNNNSLIQLSCYYYQNQYVIHAYTYIKEATLIPYYTLLNVNSFDAIEYIYSLIGSACYWNIIYNYIYTQDKYIIDINLYKQYLANERDDNDNDNDIDISRITIRNINDITQTLCSQRFFSLSDMNKILSRFPDINAELIQRDLYLEFM